VEYGDTNPVTGDAIDVHFDGNSVQHITCNGNGVITVAFDKLRLD
jgi:hypothetical protein